MDQKTRFDEFYSHNSFSRKLLPPEIQSAVALKRGNNHALDLGCGDGRIALYLALQGFDVTGVDVSQIGLDKLREAAETSGLEDRLTLVQGDVRRVSLPRTSYDLVVAATVLDHLPEEDVPGVFGMITKVLNPGGLLFAQVHNVDDPGHLSRPDSSELRGAIKFYFPSGELRRIAEDDYDVLSYREAKEEDLSHGHPHSHSFSFMLARRR